MIGKRFTDWLSALGGADLEILRELPHEKGRFVQTGLILLLTACFAGLSIWTALVDFLDQPRILATLAAGVWAALTLSLSRFSILSMAGVQSVRKLIALAIPRIILAGLIGFIWTLPLVLRVFQADIQAAASGSANYSAKVDRLKVEVQGYEDILRGNIPTNDKSAAQALAVVQSYARERIGPVEEELASAELALRAALTTTNTISGQLRILKTLTEEIPSLRVAYWAVATLFTMVMILPVMVQVLVNLGAPSTYQRVVKLKQDSLLDRLRREKLGQEGRPGLPTSGPPAPELKFATPVGELVWRVGYRPEPWAWPDWGWATEGRFGGRWDDSEGEFRTMYAGSSLLGCLLEVLAPFRADPRVVQSLNEIVEEDVDANEFATVRAGTLDPGWLGPRVGASGRLTGWFADITATDSLAYLHPLFVAQALRLGFMDFDAATLKDTRARPLTQRVASHIYAKTPLGGAKFSSRHGDDVTLWAIFERPSDGTSSQHVADIELHELSEGHPDLVKAMSLLGLQWGIKGSSD